MLAFPAHHSVCVFSPSRGAPLALLCGAPAAPGAPAPARFTAVRWLPLPLPSGVYGDEVEVAACGSDGGVSVWRLDAPAPSCGGGGAPQVGGGALVAALPGHVGPACGLAAACLPCGGGHALASVGADATVRLWHRGGGGGGGGGAWAEAARAALRAGAACEAVAFTPLPGLGVGARGAGPLHGLLVAAGGTDCRVHLFGAAHAAPGAPCALAPLMALLGHADWVKSLSFSEHGFLGAHFGASVGAGASSVALLASASQDGHVRVWRVAAAVGGGGSEGGAPTEGGEAEPLGENALAAYEAELGSGGGGGGGAQPLNHAAAFTFAGLSWRVSADALLKGHGGWVTHVAWHPPTAAAAGGALAQPPCLLTACMDKAARLWRPSGGGWAGAWAPAAVLVPGYGGASLGLLSAAMSPNGAWVAGADLHGAVLLWGADAAAAGGWAPRASASGHYGGVTCAAWAPDGAYALTGARDCTVRAWGPSRGPPAPPWVELGRPMVHGYEVCALALSPATPFRAVVGAAEPVLRVVEAPAHFLEALGVAGAGAGAGGDGRAPRRAEYAYVPELGLSAKAVDALPAEARAAEEGPSMPDAHQPDGKDATPAERSEIAARAAVTAARAGGEGAAAPAPAPFSLLRGAPAGRPREAALRAHGRWAEADKWFGHANEVAAVAAAGAVVASACRARGAADAPVFLWCARSGALRARLAGAHSLTVEALAWGGWGGSEGGGDDGERLLFSGGRDRGVAAWCVAGGGAGARLVSAVPRAHKRAVHAVAATPPPPREDHAPAPCAAVSGSRDGAVRAWVVAEGARTLEAPPALAPPTFPTAVTALALGWLPPAAGARPALALAVGTEGGEVSLWGWGDSACASGGAPAPLCPPRSDAHPGGVACLAWRPGTAHGGGELLSGGADGALRWWRFCSA